MAARWFARLHDETATGDDWLAFEEWLTAAEEHAAAYERLEAIWAELDDLGGQVTAALDAPFELASRRAARARRASLTRRGWLGAGMAVAAGLAVSVVSVANLPSVVSRAYVTAPGQTQQITLADGTRVWLNAGSRMSVKFRRRHRDVQMADGEAVFDVTHDPERPFVIDTGDRRVRVVGTEFNLRQRGADFVLTVRRGLVEVRPSQRPHATPVRVAAGQRLTHHSGEIESVPTAAPSADAFAWTKGQLAYQDAPLSEVAADLSRSLGTPVRLRDATTARLRFSGVLALDDRAALLHRLESFVPISAEEGVGGIVLSRRAD